MAIKYISREWRTSFKCVDVANVLTSWSHRHDKDESFIDMAFCLYSLPHLIARTVCNIFYIRCYVIRRDVSDERPPFVSIKNSAGD